MATIERNIPADLAAVILTGALPGGQFGFVDEDPVSTQIRRAATRAGLSRVMYAAGGSQLVGRNNDVGIVDFTPRNVDNVRMEMKLDAQRGSEQILDGLYERFLANLREELGIPEPAPAAAPAPPAPAAAAPLAPFSAAMAEGGRRKRKRHTRKLHKTPRSRRHRRTKRAF